MKVAVLHRLTHPVLRSASLRREQNRVDNINENWASITHTLWFSVSITTAATATNRQNLHGSVISVVMIIRESSQLQ